MNFPQYYKPLVLTNFVTKKEGRKSNSYTCRIQPILMDAALKIPKDLLIPRTVFRF